MPFRGIAGAVTCSTPIEAHYEWKVENFFSLSDGEDDFYRSPEYEFSGLNFIFGVHPDTPNGYISLYLVSRYPRSPIKIRYTMGIKTAAGDTEAWASRTLEISKFHTFFRMTIIARSELLNRRQELAPGDALTITASLKIVDSSSDIGTTDVAVQTCPEDVIDPDGNGDHQTLEKTDFATFCRNIEELEGKDSDVTLEVRGMRFRVHRFILEVRAPALAAMFSDNASEAENGVVCVEDCHPEAFEVFLRFVYSGVVENLTIENVTDVYNVANKYDLPGLKEECVRHMLSNLTAGSVCSVIDVAHRHGEDLLQERASEFLVENAREVFRTAVWRKFSEENSLAYDLYMRVHKNWK